MPRHLFSDLHPVLLDALQRAAAQYHWKQKTQDRNRSLSLVWSYRSLEAQQRAHARGHSKKNGVTSFSLHNYTPTLAADCWLVVPDDKVDPVLVEGRADKPPHSTSGQGGKIILGAKLGMTGGLDLDSKGVWLEYRRWGRTLAATTVNLPSPLGAAGPPWRNTLEWGGHWEKFRDGPHIQLKKRDRAYLLQLSLQERGFQPGPLDGILGSRTRLAMRRAGKEAGLTPFVNSRSWPVTPELWAWLHATTLP